MITLKKVMFLIKILVFGFFNVSKINLLPLLEFMDIVFETNTIVKTPKAKQ